MADISEAFFQQQATLAFDSFGDIIKTVTYRSRTSGAYDESAGTRPVVETDYSTRIVAFQDFINQKHFVELDLEDQRAKRARAIIIQTELTATPKIDDEIFTLQGSVWRVEKIANINNVIWDMIIRAVKQ